VQVKKFKDGRTGKTRRKNVRNSSFDKQKRFREEKER